MLITRSTVFYTKEGENGCPYTVYAFGFHTQVRESYYIAFENLVQVDQVRKEGIGLDVLI